MVAEMASVIIGINIGPNAFAALEKSNVKIFSGQDNKSISENIGLFKSNNLDIIENSNAEAHN
jgi:predicted Fe-Mo cluster-binding NifX family protein